MRRLGDQGLAEEKVGSGNLSFTLSEANPHCTPRPPISFSALHTEIWETLGM